jgi:hypothetical protein
MKGEKYRKKYQLSKDTDLTNKYLTSITNPTVQPDRKTEMGVPIPDTQNVEYSKEYEEENKL